MGSDASMVHASAPAFSKDSGKKKKNIRAARLKQCKLDARREQWLSQVKSKGLKNFTYNATQPKLPCPTPPPSSLPRPSDGSGGEWEESIKIRAKQENIIKLEDLHDSDTESLFNSPSSTSSGMNYLMKNCLCESHSSHSSTSGSGSYTQSVNEEKDDDGDEEKGDDDEEKEDDDDDGFDDWETIADALSNANDDSENCPKSETKPILFREDIHSGLCNHDVLKKPEGLPRAWRSDDAFRPQSLPSLSRSKHCGISNWMNEDGQASLCPICYEDLDLTDTSFLPCSCGFHLCLFCHKRIMEADGRCPGCRKLYNSAVGGDQNVAITVTPSSSVRFHCSYSINPGT